MRETTALTLVGKALSHPLHERMLRLLTEGERCGCEFAPELGVDPSVVSRYLAVLKRAGLVASRQEGVRIMWRVADPQLPKVLDRLVALTREKVA